MCQDACLSESFEFEHPDADFRGLSLCFAAESIDVLHRHFGALCRGFGSLCRCCHSPDTLMKTRVGLPSKILDAAFECFERLIDLFAVISLSEEADVPFCQGAGQGGVGKSKDQLT